MASHLGLSKAVIAHVVDAPTVVWHAEAATLASHRPLLLSTVKSVTISGIMSRMVAGPDWKQTRTKITAYLGHDEPLESLFTALVPPPERGGLTTGGLWPVVWAVWLLTWQAAVWKSSRAAQVPLARRMIVALTPQRLVIWRASSRWRLRTIAGDLPRDRIASIAVSGSGSRSRTLILHLTTGASITMQVPPDSASRLKDLRRIRGHTGAAPLGLDLFLHPERIGPTPPRPSISHVRGNRRPAPEVLPAIRCV